MKFGSTASYIGISAVQLTDSRDHSVKLER